MTSPRIPARTRPPRRSSSTPSKSRASSRGVEIDTSGQTLAIEGDTATVEGIGLSGAFGVLTLGFKLEKREGGWVVTYQSQQ